MNVAFTLSDDPARLDLDRIHGWLTTSYWCPGIAREQVAKQNAGSHCLGAYLADGTQAAFARVISDRASFAWLADVWVDEPLRGQGVGRALVRWFVEHPDYAGIRRFGLTTADAHGVYEALGFHALKRPERLMERLSPDFAARLEAAS